VRYVALGEADEEQGEVIVDELQGEGLDDVRILVLDVCAVVLPLRQRLRDPVVHLRDGHDHDRVESGCGVDAEHVALDSREQAQNDHRHTECEHDRAPGRD
jgi:hypothetical protein